MNALQRGGDILRTTALPFGQQRRTIGRGGLLRSPVILPWWETTAVQAEPYSTSSKRQQRVQRCTRRSLIISKSSKTRNKASSQQQDILLLEQKSKLIPCLFRELDNTSLSTLGSMENHIALKEMLKRDVMATDHVSYEQACDTFLRIEAKNHQYERAMALPFQVGIVMWFTAGLVSIPWSFIFRPSSILMNTLLQRNIRSQKSWRRPWKWDLGPGNGWCVLNKYSSVWMYGCIIGGLDISCIYSLFFLLLLLLQYNTVQEPVLGTSTFILLCLQYMR